MLPTKGPDPALGRVGIGDLVERYTDALTFFDQPPILISGCLGPSEDRSTDVVPVPNDLVITRSADVSGAIQ